MTDFNEIEIDEEDVEKMVREMSIMSGFELGAINTVMPDTTKHLFPKYNEMPFGNSFAESSFNVDVANEYGFPDIPLPFPKSKYTH